jgi:hypothetical protein
MSGLEADRGGGIFPDAMFHGMNGWLGSDETNLNDLCRNFPGVYTVYRHSLLRPHHVAVGRLTIQHIEATGAVRTAEEYSIDQLEDFEETRFELEAISSGKTVSTASFPCTPERGNCR